MQKYLAILLLMVLCFRLNAQGYDPEKVKPKLKVQYNKAVELLQEDAFNEAVPVLLKIVMEDSNFVDAYLSLAGAFGQLKQYNRSIQFYQKAQQKDPAYFAVYQLPYSINLAGNGNFKEALEVVNAFLSIGQLNERSIKSATYRKNSYQFALDYIATHPTEQYLFQPTNLGDSVNSASSEYYPSVTVTDSLLVFTRRGNQIREDFYQSIMQNNHFGHSTLIKGDINLEEQKGAITVSQDGEWMLFAGRFHEGGFGDFDLYISYYTPDGWSEPENLGNSINTEFWESSPALSPDKRALYFSSNRPDGFGGADLYVSYRLPNGKWSPAENMGPEINSAGDDQAPFIHADNQTLYYTSNGLPGYGGSDLYLIRKNNKNKWGKPENLGYPINTIENEGSLAVSADGLTAYYASDRSDSRGQLDLYKFNLRKDIRPNRTFYVKGFITDQATGKKLPSSVELIKNSSGETLMKVQTDEQGGYFITLPTGEDYTFSVNRKGYFFYNEPVEMMNKQADSLYQKNIALQPLKLNASVIFKNIHFAFNSYQLPDYAAIELGKLYQILTENPSMHIEISGHTDNIGKPADNIVLSTRRAQAIVDWLINRGVSSERISYIGMGDEKPISDNKTEEGRALNRRTTVTITKI